MIGTSIRITQNIAVPGRLVIVSCYANANWGHGVIGFIGFIELLGFVEFVELVEFGGLSSLSHERGCV